MDWENLNWENLCDVLIKRLPERAGTYVVHWAPGGQPKPIQRVFKQDKSGILCFGMTGGSLKNRLRAFYRSARGGRGHAEGENYHLLNYAQRFPLQELQIWYMVCNNRNEARKTEIAWFEDYESRFGELPPLNRNG
jgi:hypothetical protein